MQLKFHMPECNYLHVCDDTLLDRPNDPKHRNGNGFCSTCIHFLSLGSFLLLHIAVINPDPERIGQRKGKSENQSSCPAKLTCNGNFKQFPIDKTRNDYEFYLGMVFESAPAPSQLVRVPLSPKKA